MTVKPSRVRGRACLISENLQHSRKWGEGPQTPRITPQLSGPRLSADLLPQLPPFSPVGEQNSDVLPPAIYLSKTRTLTGSTTTGHN